MAGSGAMRERTTWLLGEKLREIPLRPAPPNSPVNWSAAASQLTGLWGPFHYQLFQNRSLQFHSQQVRFDDNVVISFGFYERLESPEEVITAMRICATLTRRGVNNIPMQALVVRIFPSMYDAPDGI